MIIRKPTFNQRSIPHPKVKECRPYKGTISIRKYIFQPLIFKCHVSFRGVVLFKKYVSRINIEDIWILLDQLLKKSPGIKTSSRCSSAWPPFLVLNHPVLHTQLAAENLVDGMNLFVHPTLKDIPQEVSARKFLQTSSKWWKMELWDPYNFFWPKPWAKFGLISPLKSGESWHNVVGPPWPTGNHISWASQAAQSLWTSAPERKMHRENQKDMF